MQLRLRLLTFFVLAGLPYQVLSPYAQAGDATLESARGIAIQWIRTALARATDPRGNSALENMLAKTQGANLRYFRTGTADCDYHSMGYSFRGHPPKGYASNDLVLCSLLERLPEYLPAMSQTIVHESYHLAYPKDSEQSARDYETYVLKLAGEPNHYHL